MSKRNSTRLAASTEAVPSYLLTGKVAIVTGSGTFVSYYICQNRLFRKSHIVLPPLKHPAFTASTKHEKGNTIQPHLHVRLD